MKRKETIRQLLAYVSELITITRDIREFMPHVVPTRQLEPKLVDINWIMEFLDIKRTAFYTQVRGKELTPVKRIGRREYYDREEVYALVRRENAA